MKKYIFLTHYDDEFYELENSWATVVWIVNWKNQRDAFKNLKRKEKIDYIGETWDYENYFCYELTDWKRSEFRLNSSWEII